MLALWLTAAGCVYDPTFDVTCESNADCSAGAMCADGVCVNVDDEPDMPDTDGEVTQAEPARIEVSAPTGTEIPVGISAPLEATVFDADDNEIDVAVTWSSADASVATVNGDGLVTGVSAGETDIIATAGEVTATTTVTILAPVDSVEIEIPDNPVGQGLTQQLVARALDATGSELPGRDVEWSSSNGEVVEIDADGRMTAITLGSADITADIEGTTATATVTVEENPVASVVIAIDDGAPPTMADAADVPLCLSETFIALIKDGDENFLDPRGREYTWEVPAGGMSTAAISTLPPGEFNDHRRRATGNDAGSSVELTVTVDATQTDSITLDVVDYPVDTVEITAPGAAVPFGSRVAMEFTVDGDPPPDARCIDAVWSSSDEMVATVDTDGVLTAVGPGTTDVGLDVNGVAAAAQPVDVALLVESVSTGDAHSCGVSPDGVAICWGINQDGQLGVSTPPNDPAEPVAIDDPRTFTSVHAADDFSCGLDNGGTAWCWGAARGTGGAGQSDLPVEVAGHVFASIEAKFGHACGIEIVAQGDDEVWCWGAGSDGQLGDGNGADSETPVKVDLAGSGATGNPTDLAIGLGHSCAVTDTDEAWCWGAGSDGQLGNDAMPASEPAPVQVMAPAAFASIAAGQNFTCARGAGEVYCWGANADGTLGTGDTTPSAVPTGIGMDLLSLSLGVSHGCGIDPVTEVVHCWGLGAGFRLGTGDETDQLAPTPIDGDFMATAIAAGSEHTCAVDPNLVPHCWGKNTNERGGTGADPLETPTPVWP